MHFKGEILKIFLNILSFRSCIALNKNNYECWMYAGYVLKELKRYNEAL